jgi:hypothetical protein
MFSYQECNTKYPLNGLAAKWAAQHTHLLPIDPRNISPASEPAAPLAHKGAVSEIIPPEANNDDPWGNKIVIR